MKVKVAKAGKAKLWFGQEVPMNRSARCRLGFVLAVGLAIGCKDKAALEAKDREIAELKAKVSSQPAPSLGAVQQNAQPPIVAPAPQPEEAEAPVVTMAKRLRYAIHHADDLMALYQEARQSRLTYAQLKKNADRYRGTPFAFQGKVLEIQAPGNGSEIARVSLDYYGNLALWVVSVGESNYTEGDLVDVIGFITGSHTYQSQAGWNITIPEMVAAQFLKAGTLKSLAKAGSAK